MDANGLRFWLLSDAAHWRTGAGAAYDARCRRLRLRSERDRPLPPDGGDASRAAARAALDVAPQARDAYGMRAAWVAARGALMATGAVPGARPLWRPEGAAAPTDAMVGHDGVLHLAQVGAVVLHDLRGRWSDVPLQVDGFAAWRLAPDPEGGAWVLDRDAQRLAHVHHLPPRDGPLVEHSPCTARPCAEDPAPPSLVPLPRARWEGSQAVALATSPGGRLAVLGWRDDGDARLHVQGAHGQLDVVLVLRGARSPYALAWTSDDAIAVRVPELPGEALVYEVADAIAEAERLAALHEPAPVEVVASGGFWPTRGALAAPFDHGVSLPPHYPAAGGDGALPQGSLPLHPLSVGAWAPRGEARAARPMDSGSTGTVWHRLYAEARLPARCGARVFLAASDTPEEPASADEWHEHRFGDLPAADDAHPVPRAAWMRGPSEIPFHAGMLGEPGEPGRAGLFTVLVQRTNRPVRALRGRWLWVRVALAGDGRATPEIAALRAYGSRASWVERHLPDLYHEQLVGAERDVVLPAGARPASTAADFLERFLGNFEGVLTPIEDRVAGAWLLTDARTVPEASLEWLGSWIGVAFDDAYPPERRRRLLAESPRLFRERGTLAGLCRALDVATGGGCTDGRLVVLEHWRLRRTFATILGADLADEADPLLAGLARSGNSVVGDTLFVGDEPRGELAALFTAARDLSARGMADERAALDFFERLAWRATVLVHDAVDAETMGLVRRVAELESPAHVAVEVVAAPAPFLAGVASLVGTDSFLRAAEPVRPVEASRSLLGVRDVLVGPASLDPRLAGATLPAAADPRPVARLRAPPRVRPDEAFLLDGRESRASPGRRLAQFRWQQLT